MAQFDYVEFRAFDYDGFKQSLFDVASAEFTQWSDTLESNQGVMFVEWLAFIASNLTWMQNFHARQAFVSTATEAASMAKLAKQFAYQIPNNVAASVNLTFSTESGDPLAADVIIPAGTQVKTTGTEQIIFETTSDLSLLAGDTSGSVTAKNQETKVENDTADGSADFKTALTYAPYVGNTMRVTVGGIAYVEVDNFLDSNGTAEHYVLEVDSSGLITVTFGDGVNGKLLPLGSDIEYTYCVGGGVQGNVAIASVTVLDEVLYDVNNDPVDLVVTNAAVGTGGDGREDIDVTRIKIPASIAAKEVTLSYQDFRTNIENVDGVARVSVKTVNDNDDIPENTVLVTVLPTTADTIDTALQNAILSELDDNPTTLTLNLILISPDFLTLDIDVRDLTVEAQFDDDSGEFASATITIVNNSFQSGDGVVVNGVSFVQTTDFVVAGSASGTATNLANAISSSSDPLLQDIEATADSAVVTVTARTKGQHANSYTLTEIDTGTNNFTLSGATLSGGEDTGAQAAIRSAIDAFFGRENLDKNGDYTVGFGQTIYRNDLIWTIRDVEIDGVKPVDSFSLSFPIAEETTLELNQFPKYTLKFTTSEP